MYSEHEKRVPMQRANDEFLRRMLGGELTMGTAPVFNEETPALPTYPEPPSCDGTIENTVGECGQNGNCSITKGAPSLAMVYAPCQTWNGVFDPMTALEHGSQFRELVLPFERYSNGAGGKSCHGSGRGCL